MLHHCTNSHIKTSYVVHEGFIPRDPGPGQQAAARVWGLAQSAFCEADEGLAENVESRGKEVAAPAAGRQASSMHARTLRAHSTGSMKDRAPCRRYVTRVTVPPLISPVAFKRAVGMTDPRGPHGLPSFPELILKLFNRCIYFSKLCSV